jgi:hypothetical protein
VIILTTVVRIMKSGGSRKDGGPSCCQNQFARNGMKYNSVKGYTRTGRCNLYHRSLWFTGKARDREVEAHLCQPREIQDLEICTDFSFAAVRHLEVRITGLSGMTFKT